MFQVWIVVFDDSRLVRKRVSGYGLIPRLRGSQIGHRKLDVGYGDALIAIDDVVNFVEGGNSFEYVNPPL